MKQVETRSVPRTLPLKYYGGKSRFIDWILKYMPPHRAYLEPWGGSASVLLLKPNPFKGVRTRIQVYNDLDHRVYNFFYVLRDPVLRKELVGRLRWTPYSREEHAFCQQYLDDRKQFSYDPFSGLSEEDQWRVEWARRYFVCVRQSFGAALNGGWAIKLEPDRNMLAPQTFQSVVESLEYWGNRLKDVFLECDDWEAVCRRWNTEDFLWYCDPPYVLETRVGEYYAHEMSLEDHQRMVQFFLTEAKAMIMLAGYAHAVYEPLEEAGWRRVELQTRTQWTTDETPSSPRVECMWISPSAWEANARTLEQQPLFEEGSFDDE